MRTMPRQYPFPAPAGERRVDCAYCGLKWYRSQCIRDATGQLVCPDDQDGRDNVTLDRANVAAAAQATRRTPTGGDW